MLGCRGARWLGRPSRLWLGLRTPPSLSKLGGPICRGQSLKKASGRHLSFARDSPFAQVGLPSKVEFCCSQIHVILTSVHGRSRHRYCHWRRHLVCLNVPTAPGIRPFAPLVSPSKAEGFTHSCHPDLRTWQQQTSMLPQAQTSGLSHCLKGPRDSPFAQVDCESHQKLTASVRLISS